MKYTTTDALKAVLFIQVFLIAVLLYTTGVAFGSSPIWAWIGTFGISLLILKFVWD